MSSKNAAPKFDFHQLLGDKLLRKESGKTELQPTSKVLEHYVALYFSAHWCPPCRQFTPQLANTYRLVKEQNKRFEVVFVSSDRDVEAFSEYFESMPWAALPFGEHLLRKQLASTFQITSIPALIILGPNGELINADARSEVAQDPMGFRFPWHGSKQLQAGGVLDTNKFILLLLVLYLLYRFLFS